jgi:excisionase family DNA binding protein
MKENLRTETTNLDVLSESEAATRLGVSRMTLQRARKRGEIVFSKVGRRVLYKTSSLLAFLARFERNNSQQPEGN